MGLLQLLFGKKPAATKAAGKRSSPPQFASSNSVQGSASSPHGVRKDLLRLVLRETLQRNGIPSGWLSADLLRTTTARREDGIHVRFLVREWEPRLMVHGVAFEKEYLQRLLLLDPLAVNWLMGFSWQFVLKDVSACPAMPHPGSWTAAPASTPMPRPAEPQHSGDVIEGPVMVPEPQDSVRGDLDRLFATLRDEDVRRYDGQRGTYAPTRPASLV